MSVAVNFTSCLQVQESIQTLGAPVTNYNHTELNEVIQNQGASTSNPCSKVAVSYYLLSGGVGTLDLTALAAEIGSYTQTIDGSNGGGTSATDYVQFVKFINPTTAMMLTRGRSHTNNSAGIVIKAGLTNSNNMLGASFLFTLVPGQSALFSLNSLSPVITPTTKNIALTGTGTDELWYEFVLGGP